MRTRPTAPEVRPRATADAPSGPTSGALQGDQQNETEDQQEGGQRLRQEIGFEQEQRGNQGVGKGNHRRQGRPAGRLPGPAVQEHRDQQPQNQLGGEDAIGVDPDQRHERRVAGHARAVIPVERQAGQHLRRSEVGPGVAVTHGTVDPPQEDPLHRTDQGHDPSDNHGRVGRQASHFPPFPGTGASPSSARRVRSSQV